jgi:hypothetical protein
MVPPSESGEIAFFQIAAALIPLLVFSGIVAERHRPGKADGPVKLTIGAIAVVVLGGLGVAAEVICLRGLIAGSGHWFWIPFVAAVLAIGLATVVGFACWPWMKELNPHDETEEMTAARRRAKLWGVVLAISSVVVITVGLGATYFIVLTATETDTRAKHEQKVTELKEQAAAQTRAIQRRVRFLEYGLSRSIAARVQARSLLRADASAVVSLKAQISQGGAPGITQAPLAIFRHRLEVVARLESADRDAMTAASEHATDLARRLTDARHSLAAFELGTAE